MLGPDVGGVGGVVTLSRENAEQATW